jgi:hypothetical protein
MPAFIPGLELNERFYAEVVGPLVDPWPHAAARLGTGSEVLGFDTERSTDHGWGPQLLIVTDAVESVLASVEAGLPATFRGWPVCYGWDDIPVAHHVVVSTLREWLVSQIGTSLPLTATDWLLVPQQKLLEVTRGAVYHDDTGELTVVRDTLAWYPDDVWLWMLASQWHRVAQEEAFIGRTAEVGDELGSRIVTARVTRELMRLWFLLHRVYWPYTKWFGSAFSALPDQLGAALTDGDIVTALEVVANRHNQLGITEPVDPSTRPFYNRPFTVLMADRFTEACLARVSPSLRALPLVGSIDQFADSTDLLSHGHLPRRLAALYATSLD